MRIRPAVFLALVVVIASCGSSSDVPEDTEAVAAGPREPEAVDQAAPASDPESDRPTAPPAEGPRLGDGAEPAVGFAAKGRFVVYAEAEATSFVVFDREANETFRVLGSPMGERATPFDLPAEIGLSAGMPRIALEADDRGRLLVRSPGGIQLVDLAERGRMIAAWRGTPVSVSLAPDGAMFAVTTSDAMVLVRASDGGFATYPASFGDAEVVPQWGERAVWWVADGKLRRVDRATLRSSIVTAPAGSEPPADRPDRAVRFATSRDADVVAVGWPGGVSVHLDGSPVPVLRVATPYVSDLVVDADGKTVVWIEREDDPEGTEDRGHLHAIDVASRAHVRFAMTGSGCAIAPETVQRVSGGKIVTDASCSLGCPSVRWTHRAVTYDATSGRILEDTSTTEERSANEQLAEEKARIDHVAARLRLEPAAMMRAPGNDQLVVARGGALALVALSDRAAAPIALESSEGAKVDSIAFSLDGSIVAGIVDGRARAWDTATGAATLR